MKCVNYLLVRHVTHVHASECATLSVCDVTCVLLDTLHCLVCDVTYTVLDALHCLCNVTCVLLDALHCLCVTSRLCCWINALPVDWQLTYIGASRAVLVMVSWCEVIN